MCGIVAMFAPAGRVAAETLEAAVRTLHHRGPDGHRTWTSADGRVGLGHARLAIIDLSTGDQPIGNEDGTVRAVVNGELYDHDRILRDLAERGHRPGTRSDSEILVHLYEERGVHCLDQLRGEFAFVLWDAANRALFAARDRFGIKPLYYAEHQGTLYLASEAKALFAAGVPAIWDRESVYRVLEGLPFDNDRSLFRGVRQVPPGHLLYATDGQVRIRSYWDLDYPQAGSPAPGTTDEQVQRVAELFDEAVRLRLRADVPVGCYLSGGIDSCAVLGFMARHGSAPVEAYTIAFDEDLYNEEAVARQMASGAGAELHTIAVTEEMLVEHFPDAVCHSEIFPRNTHSVAKYLLSRLVRDRGRKVVLTGEGADEIFAGYVDFRRDMALTTMKDHARMRSAIERLVAENPALRNWLNFTGIGPEVDPRASAAVRVLGYVPSQLQGRLDSRARSLMAPAFVREFSAGDPVASYLASIDVGGQLRGREPLHQSLYLGARGMLANYILNTLGDRIEMAHSVEARLPFLDHHLVEYVRNVPPDLKVHGENLQEKWILRQAVRPFVTDAVFGRHKHSFLAPSPRPNGRFHALLQDMLRSRVVADVPFFDAAAMADRLDRVPSMSDAERDGWTPTLTMALAACCLQQRFRPS